MNRAKTNSLPDKMSKPGPVYIVRNMQGDMAVGWASKAIALGLRVSSRPGRFGDEEYIVKDRGGNAIQLKQNMHNTRRLDARDFTPGQHSIAAALQECNLLSK